MSMGRALIAIFVTAVLFATASVSHAKNKKVLECKFELDWARLEADAAAQVPEAVSLKRALENQTKKKKTVEALTDADIVALMLDLQLKSSKKYIQDTKSRSHEKDCADCGLKEIEDPTLKNFISPLAEALEGDGRKMKFYSLTSSIPKNIRQQRDLKPIYEKEIESQLPAENGKTRNIIYNQANDNIFDFLEDGRMQCMSGTHLHQTILKDLRSKGFQLEEPLVVLTEGHIQSAYVNRDAKPKDVLLTIEHTARGNALKYRGKIQELSGPVRVIDADSYLRMQVSHNYLKDVDALTGCIAKRAAKKLKLKYFRENEQQIAELKKKKKASSGSSNGNPLSFGESDVPEGDRERKEISLQDAISGSSWANPNAESRVIIDRRSEVPESQENLKYITYEDLFETIEILSIELKEKSYQEKLTALSDLFKNYQKNFELSSSLSVQQKTEILNSMLDRPELIIHLISSGGFEKNITVLEHEKKLYLARHDSEENWMRDIKSRHLLFSTYLDEAQKFEKADDKTINLARYGSVIPLHPKLEKRKERTKNSLSGIDFAKMSDHEVSNYLVRYLAEANIRIEASADAGAISKSMKPPNRERVNAYLRSMVASPERVKNLEEFVHDFQLNPGNIDEEKPFRIYLTDTSPRISGTIDEKKATSFLNIGTNDGALPRSMNVSINEKYPFQLIYRPSTYGHDREVNDLTLTIAQLKDTLGGTVIDWDLEDESTVNLRNQIASLRILTYVLAESPELKEKLNSIRANGKIKLSIHSYTRNPEFYYIKGNAYISMPNHADYKTWTKFIKEKL